MSRSEIKELWTDKIGVTADQEARQFYDKHRGGSGAVVLVIVCGENGNDEYGIFGSIEAAEAWALTQDDPVVFSPYIVDDAEWGNRQTQ
jgi:hypothetical protein